MAGRLRNAFVLTLAVFLSAQSRAYAEHLYDPSNRWLQTEHFTFKIPSPWSYAIPKNNGKNQARCFLQSKLQMFSKGLFLIDVGQPTGSVQDTLTRLLERMVPEGKHFSDLKIEQKPLELDGVTAVAFVSDQTIAKVPCLLVVCFNNDKQRLFLCFASVSTNDGLQHRDAMLENLETTWKWR